MPRLPLALRLSRVPGIPRGLVVLALLALLPACGALPVPTHVGTRTLEKDVIIRDVEVTEQVRPASYKRWADLDRDTLGPEPRHPRFDVPLYEVIYSFRQGDSILATVIYRRDEDHWEHLETRVYSERNRAAP